MLLVFNFAPICDSLLVLSSLFYLYCRSKRVLSLCRSLLFIAVYTLLPELMLYLLVFLLLLLFIARSSLFTVFLVILFVSFLYRSALMAARLLLACVYFAGGALQRLACT